MAMQQQQPQQPMQLHEMLVQYKQYVRANPEKVKRAEEAGRLGAMLLPVGRLGQYSELMNELFYSVLGLVGSFHDHIIYGESLPRKANHKLRVLLNLLSHTEVVLEMSSKQFGGESRHRQFIYILECLKALVRLVILANTPKGSILIGGGQYDAKAGQPPVNPFQPPQPETTEPETESKTESKTEAEEPEQKKKNPRWVGRRSGKVLRLNESLSEHDNTDKYEPEEKTNSEAEAGVTRANARMVDLQADDLLRNFGEILSILRPVVYVSLFMRTTKQKWHPWLLSLMIDLLSFRVTSVAIAPQIAPESCNTPFECAVQKVILGPGKLKTDDETKKAVAELGRRRLLLFFYLMRSPLYDNYTLAAVQRIRGGLESLPVIGSIGGMIEETLQYYHKTHFYISAS